MSQHDMTIANDTRTNVRTDIQSALQALASTNKGNSRPSTPYAGQMWIDANTPSSTVWSLFVYDGSDDILLGFIDSTNNGFSPYFGVTSYIQQSTEQQPGYGNTTIGGSFTTDVANGASLYLSRAAFAGIRLNCNSDDNVAEFFRSGVAKGSISVTSSATAFNTTSDRRAKVILGPVADAVRRLRKIDVVRAFFKADKRKRQHDVFVADQLQAVAPYAVTGKKGAVDKAGKPVFQQVDPAKLMPLVVAALQDALASIDSLKARVAELEARANG